MEHADLKETNALISRDELEFAFALIEQGTNVPEAHSRNRSKLWDRGLPFYTILSDKKKISLKEYPNGTRELIRRHINENGSITDELIEEPTR